MSEFDLWGGIIIFQKHLKILRGLIGNFSQIFLYFYLDASPNTILHDRDPSPACAHEAFMNNKTGNSSCTKESDHRTILIELNVNLNPACPSERIEHFDYKNTESFERFICGPIRALGRSNPLTNHRALSNLLMASLAPISSNFQERA